MRKKYLKTSFDYKGLNYLVEAKGDVVITGSTKSLVLRDIKAKAGSKNLGNSLKDILLGLKESMIYIALHDYGGENLSRSDNSLSNYDLVLKYVNASQIINFSYRIKYLLDKNQNLKTFMRNNKRYVGLTQKGKKGFVSYQRYEKLKNIDDY